MKSTANNKKRSSSNKEIFAALFFAALSIILIIIYSISNTGSSNHSSNTNNSKNTNKETEKTSIEIINEKSNERPLAVIIDNDIGTTKHAGLQDSYINYEIITENNKTKILALYKDSEVGIIGPVESANHYFLYYALEHNAVLTSYGMTEYTQKLINADNYDYINKDNTSTFMQDKETTSHNIYTSTTRMKDTLKAKNYATTSTSWKVFDYSLEEINLKDKKDSKKATTLNIEYFTNEVRQYKYDSANKYYLRYNNDNADLDRKTNEQLHYKNIIVMYVENSIIPKENIVDVITTGEGKGLYITNGYSININWKKDNQTSKTKYTYTDGTILKLNDGNTFVQIVPADSMEG